MCVTPSARGVLRYHSAELSTGAAAARSLGCSSMSRSPSMRCQSHSAKARLTISSFACQHLRRRRGAMRPVGASLPKLELTLHQIDPSKAGALERRPVSLGRWWVLLLSLAAATGHADPQPTTAMMAPVQALVAFMSTLHPGEHPSVFSRRGLCIVENFAPFLFCG